MPIALVPLATFSAWLDGVEREIVYTLSCRWYTPWLDRVFVTTQGRGLAAVLVLVALGLILRRSRRLALRTFLAGGIAFGCAMGIASVLWPLVDRARPSQSYAVVLRTPEELATCRCHPEALALRMDPAHSPSFPSRHALTIGAFVTAIWLASWRLGLLAALYGSVVAVGRVYVGKHWPTDVLAGILIGTALSLLWWRLVPPLLGRFGRRDLVEDPPGEDLSASSGPHGGAGDADEGDLPPGAEAG